MKTNLDPSQYLAVHSPAPSLLCIAGPGSGKTTVLCERIHRLAEIGHDPGSMAVITYTNAAANELKARLEGHRLGYCGTLHGFVYGLIAAHPEAIGFAARPAILDQEQADAMLEQSIKTCRYKGSKKDIEAAIKAGPFALANLAVCSQADTIALHFYGGLRDANLLTFDTILWYGLRLITGSGVHETCRYTHLFVDEFQDASDLDAAIYEALPIANKFLVGDPDQAIYGFRGGSVEHILRLARELETIHLERNFRSDRAICQAAQSLIEHNQGRVAKATVAASKLDGQASLHAFDTSAREAGWLAARINDVLTGGNSVAVLVRTNHLVDQLSGLLAGYGIPVASRQAIQIPADWRDAKIMLGLLADPENDTMAYWFIRSTKGPEQAELCRLQALAAGESINSKYLHIGQVTHIPAVQALFDARYSADTCQIIRKAIGIIGENESLSTLILALSEAEQATQQTSQGVTVTTYHSAKGREWDVVFLPAFEQGTIPLGRDCSEEERRLAFVAMTRARHGLHISWAASRQIQYLGQMTQQPSQFIEEAYAARPHQITC